MAPHEEGVEDTCWEDGGDDKEALSFVEAPFLEPEGDEVRLGLRDDSLEHDQLSICLKESSLFAVEVVEEESGWVDAHGCLVPLLGLDGEGEAWLGIVFQDVVGGLVGVALAFEEVPDGPLGVFLGREEDGEDLFGGREDEVFSPCEDDYPCVKFVESDHGEGFATFGLLFGEVLSGPFEESVWGTGKGYTFDVKAGVGCGLSEDSVGSHGSASLWECSDGFFSSRVDSDLTGLDLEGAVLGHCFAIVADLLGLFFRSEEEAIHVGTVAAVPPGESITASGLKALRTKEKMVAQLEAYRLAAKAE